MKKLFLTLAVIFLAASPCFAQSYTQVTATVKDPAGAIYANGSWEANLDISGVSSGSLVTFQRTTSFEASFSGQMDSFGKFSVTLPSNDAIMPVNKTEWAFKFCQHYTTPTQSPAPACFGLTLAITGVSMDITSQVQAAAASLSPITPGLVGGSLLPTVTGTYNLGSPTATWATLYANNIAAGTSLSVSTASAGTITLQTNSGTVSVPTGSITLGGVPLAVYPGSGIAVSTGSAWAASLTAPSGAIVGTTDTQTLSNKTLTAPVINTSASGSALQGSDGKLLTAGTISGTGSSLCVDSSGGATTTGCAGGSSATIVGTVDLTSQSAAIAATTILTPSTAGLYRVTMWAGKDSSPTWSAGTVTLKASCTWNGVVENLSLGAINYGNATGTAFFNDSTPYCDTSAPIQYEVDFSSVTGTPVYDIHVVVEQM